MIGGIDISLGNQISCGGNPPAAVIGCDCEVRPPQMAGITHTRSGQGLPFNHFSRLSLTSPCLQSPPPLGPRAGDAGWWAAGHRITSQCACLATPNHPQAATLRLSLSSLSFFRSRPLTPGLLTNTRFHSTNAPHPLSSLV